ncbi:hypothetical protein HPB52_012903 [Rhipicephalus sanguineus]|uniref:RING-type domain-containing protein n=1 Tax=Rhipicephalus sanguineus TaxID=34632 RepID=A0A9D4QG05_RHISA|nr:hypothetical protein HPB52_012903 [Rhipicephalus sanguineus]
MLGLLLVGWYVDHRVAPLLPSISCGDDDEANSRLPPTAVGSVDCTDGNDAHDVATAADNAASGATTDTCSSAHGDASAPECDVIAESRGPSTSLSHSSSAVSVVRTSELAVRHEIGVDDTRLALPATVPEWVVTAVDIASEALAIVRGHHPYAELIRWTGLRSDAPFWQWLSHKERTDQDSGNVVPASDIDQSDVDADDVAPRDRSVHPEGDVLRRPSNATGPPSGHQGNLVDDPAHGVVPEAITARRRLPIRIKASSLVGRMKPTGREYRMTGFGDFLEWRMLRFAEPLPKIRVCALCGVVASVVKLLPCTHVLCECCEGQAIDMGRLCPIEGASFAGEDLQTLPFSRRDLGERQVFCFNNTGHDKQGGCDFSGKLEELERHFMVECFHGVVRCSKCSGEGKLAL